MHNWFRCISFGQNCIRDLRERVARGGDPTKLHETPDESNNPADEQGMVSVVPFFSCSL